MNIKDQSVKELQVKYEELSKDIFDMKNEIRTTHKLDKPHRMQKIKRDRARVLTFWKQKEKQARGN